MLALLAFAAVATSADAAPPRREVPIREVVLSDGTRRYAVDLQIAGHIVTAGLDTGSVGLRLLPDAAIGTTPGATADHIGYGAGTTLDGVVAEAPLAIGALAATVRVQAVRTIGCAATRPDCPAGKVDPSRFGLQGNGLPGEGFRAILGTGLASVALPNPLAALGVRRWIVELPRPGEARPGRLILDPDDDERAGFAKLPLADHGRSRRNDAVDACLALADGSDRVCAPTLIDSGAPGIDVVNRAAKTAWRDGASARLTLGKAGDAPTVAFEIGRRAQASHLAFVRDDRVAGPRIRSGLLAYFAFDILYDAADGSIAVRPRPPYPQGARAVAAGASSQLRRRTVRSRRAQSGRHAR
jgi:hypothetical protein